MERIYLDNSATTRPFEETILAMETALKRDYYNPSAAYFEGRNGAAFIKSAKDVIAKSINARQGEIYFTSGGTESINTALRCTMALGDKKRNKLIISDVEHPATENTAKYLEGQGIEVIRIPFQGGELDFSAFERALDEKVKLVSFMAVNNETGYCFPIEEIKDILSKKAPHALFHCDAVQAYLKLPMDVKKLGIDMLSLSAHKIHGPKGVGALFIREGLHLPPLIFGGGQENNFRSGTENTPGIAGFKAACEVGFRSFEDRVQKLKSLKEYTKNLLKDCPGVLINSREDSAPHILNLSILDIRSEVALNYLDAKGISVSAGSACSARKTGENRVLLNSNIKPEYAKCAIRISFGDFNTKEDVDILVHEIKNCIRECKF